MTKNVKHFAFNKFGDIDVFEEVLLPVELSNTRDVRVKVERVGINPVDSMMRSGSMSNTSKPDGYLVLGSELQGEVTELFNDQTDFKIGDKVLVKMTTGAYAEEVTVNHTHVYKIPEGMPLDFASGFSSTAITAHWAVNGPFYSIKPGITVGVVGASGSVGSFVVQLLKDKDVEIVAVASSKNKESLLNLGATTFIDYADQSAVEAHKESVDYVIDASLFNSGEAVALDLLKDGGTYLAMTRMPEVKGSKKVVAKFLRRDATMTADKALESLFDFYNKHGLELKISYTLPLTLEGVKQAHNLITGTRNSGKIILSKEA